MEDIARQAGYSARYQLLLLIRFATNAFSIMLEPYLLPPFVSDHFIQLINKFGNKKDVTKIKYCPEMAIIYPSNYFKILEEGLSTVNVWPQ